MDFLYVISTDKLDDKCFARFGACLESLSRQTIAGSIRACIADYSTHSVLERLEIPESLNWDYFHRPLDAPFNKPFCINYGFKRFNIDREAYFFFSDIDLVYPEDFARRLIDKYSRLGDMVCAMGLQFYQQPEHEIYTPDYSTARDSIHDDIRYEGGCLMISTALFKHLRGYDERYFGWGGEDDDFFMRAGFAGLFVVDESLELVHMHHPGDRRKQSANTERLNRRRRDRSDWFEDRPWGMWETRPKAPERTKATLEAGICVRRPHFVALIESGDIRLHDLKNRTDHRLSPAELTTWMMSDGVSGFQSISSSITDSLSIGAQDAEQLAFEATRSLSEAGIIDVGVRSGSKPLVQVGLINGEHASTLEIRLLLWILSHEFDVALTPGGGWNADISVAWHTRDDPPRPPADAPGLNLLWSAAGPYPAGSRLSFDAILTSHLVSREHVRDVVRIPRWMPMFNWEQGRDDDYRISPVILSETSDGPVAPEWDCVLVLPEDATGNSAGGWMSSIGRRERVRKISTDAHPREKFECFRRSRVVAIVESRAHAGSVGADLVLAAAAGSLSIYSGDPVAHWDIDARRFVDVSGKSDADIVSLVDGFVGDPSSRRPGPCAPLFRSEGIPGWLLPHMAGRRLRETWDARPVS